MRIAVYGTGGAGGYFGAKLAQAGEMVYINLNPLAATVFGAVFLGEKLTPVYVVGFVAVGVGVLLVNWPSRPRYALRQIAT